MEEDKDKMCDIPQSHKHQSTKYENDKLILMRK